MFGPLGWAELLKAGKAVRGQASRGTDGADKNAKQARRGWVRTREAAQSRQGRSTAKMGKAG